MKTDGIEKIFLFLIQTLRYFKTVQVPGPSQDENYISPIFTDDFFNFLRSYSHQTKPFSNKRKGENWRKKMSVMYDVV